MFASGVRTRHGPNRASKSRSPTSTQAVAATAVAGFFSVGVIIGLSIFMPLYFELVLGFSPSGSGTALIVFLAAATIGSFIAGRLMVRLMHYKLVPMGGQVLLSVRYYLYGDQGASAISAAEQDWAKWIARHFPSPA